MGCFEIVQLVTAFIGTLGFGVLFNIRGKKLLFASFGGFFSWFLFLILGMFFQNEFLRYFIVSISAAVYAEILARILKTPTTTFCIVSLVPLIPGSALYYSTTYALESNAQMFVSKAVYTLELAAALSLGIVMVTAITKYITAFMKYKHNNGGNNGIQNIR